VLVAAISVVVGLALITLGGEAIVRGAGRVAKALGVPSVVIALTLVACGTSFPELGINMMAAFRDATDLAMGNVIGSNIANILLVLGLASVVRPLSVHLDLIKRESPFLFALQGGLVLLVLDGQLGRFDGLLLLTIGAVYMIALIRATRRAQLNGVEDAKPTPGQRIWVSVLLSLAGFGMLYLGARWFVRGALELVVLLDLSQRVVGLTVAALGTSAPEIASSVTAAYRGKSDLAVGNVLGSCIFNLVFVLGVTATIYPIPVSLDFATGMGIDMAVVVLATVVLIPILVTGHRVVRAEGILLLLGYVLYIGYLLSQAT